MYQNISKIHLAVSDFSGVRTKMKLGQENVVTIYELILLIIEKGYPFLPFRNDVFQATFLSQIQMFSKN